MSDLNDLIDPVAGWTLKSAYAINDLGWIVGYGTHNGQSRGFVLTPIPEPSALSLLAACALGLLTRRGQKVG
jgi:hypothetical protein